jgi:hypothetical protein
MDTLEILSKIFKNPEDDLALFADLDVLEFFEDDKGRVLVKTFEYNGKDKVVLSDKNRTRGNSASAFRIRFT